eukprot:NODE_1937_length_1030_cov_134.593272_g1575_i0.p3 GENE.NODE_1937_length_1030_cov_134.593272_g1575_i0~~NODE_1937_length_1030_cov_134.593272_g1575_i0.p3  ORF type:complete len:80 (+),score=8.81 NODE_1937_length_1030_cov_134.593272_g1575_i0:736-975(+)
MDLCSIEVYTIDKVGVIDVGITYITLYWLCSYFLFMASSSIIALEAITAVVVSSMGKASTTVVMEVGRRDIHHSKSDSR